MTNRWSIYAFAVVGLAIVIVVGIEGSELASPTGYLGSHHVRNIWQVWDVAAALWSLSFFFYYFIEFTSTRSQWLDKTLLLILILSSVGVPAAIFYFLLWVYNPVGAIYSTIGLNFVYLFIDGVLAFRPPGLDRQRSYQEAFWLADAPIVLSNLAFVVWLQFHQEPNWAVFASGMVGFQLLSCNIIFVITQTGIVRAIWIREEMRSAVEQPTA